MPHYNKYVYTAYLYQFLSGTSAQHKLFIAFTTKG